MCPNLQHLLFDMRRRVVRIPAAVNRDTIIGELRRRVNLLVNLSIRDAVTEERLNCPIRTLRECHRVRGNIPVRPATATTMRENLSRKRGVRHHRRTCDILRRIEPAIIKNEDFIWRQCTVDRSTDKDTLVYTVDSHPDRIAS